MSKDRFVSRHGNKVILNTENDGWTFMNRGPEATEKEVIRVEGDMLVLADGGRSGGGRLAEDARRYFAEIEKESKANS